MPRHQARTDEEYEDIKTEISKKINESNAEKVFIEAKEKILHQIKKLDVNDINEIEDFYLTLHEINRSLCFILAKESKKNNNFNDNIGIGAADITSFLVATFKASINQHYFLKIIEIQGKYNPDTQEWAALHIGLLTVSEELSEDKKIFNLTKIIEEKSCFLKKEAVKFKENGNIIASEEADKLSTKIEKITQKHLNNRNEDEFKRDIRLAIDDARPFLENQQGWKKTIDDILKTIVNVFRKEPLNTGFSFFANPVKEGLDELDTSTNPKMDSV